MAGSLDQPRRCNIPIYQFKCNQCGNSAEHLMSYEDTKTTEVVCARCDMNMPRQVSLIAKTATAWNANWNEGLSGNQFSYALGHKVANKRQEETILRSRGFIPETELGQHWIADRQEELQAKHVEQNERAKVYQETLASTGDAQAAVVAAFPAEDCLSGKLDSTYDTSIKI